MGIAPSYLKRDVTERASGQDAQTAVNNRRSIHL